MNQNWLIRVGLVILVLGIISISLGAKGCLWWRKKHDTTSGSSVVITRAKSVAETGIHWASAQVQSHLAEKGPNDDHLYYGEDFNGDGVITPGLEQYENQDGDGILQGLDCPLYRAVHPSFMVDLDKDGDLDQDDLINVQGKWVGVSGIMPGPYNPTMGAYYTVKVQDLSGRLCINMLRGQEHDQEHMHDNGEIILQNLCTEIFDNEAKGEQIGSAIYRGLPYLVLDELKEKAGLTQEEYEVIRPHLTIYGYYDLGVIKPVPFNLFYRIGDMPYPFPDFGEDIFSWRQVRPETITYPKNNVGQRVGRAPVNINTAAQPVLVALLKGLGGLYFDEDSEFVCYEHRHSHLIGYRYTYNPFDYNKGTKGSLGATSFTPEITRSMAQQIAQIIIQNRGMEPDPTKPWRGPFRGWQQFNLFCDEVLWHGNDPLLSPILTTKLTPQQADVLKANFNPNSNLSAFNPPTQRLFWVDKINLYRVYRDKYGRYSQADCYTTEFSFFPSGYFEITTLGRLLDSNNEVMSEAEITAVVRLFALYKETTQADFLEDFVNGQRISEIISPNDDPGATGQDTTHDLTLQTYPEILEFDPYKAPGYCRGTIAGTGPGTGHPYVQDAHYDGYIALATVENRVNPDFRVSFGKDGNPNTSLDADTDEVVERDEKGPYVNRLVAAPESSREERQAFPNAPGTLFPDGVYSELDSVPAYDYRPNNLNVFTTSLWLKPHFFPESSSKCRTWFTYQVYIAGAWRGSCDPFNRHPIAPLGIYSIPSGVEENFVVRREDYWNWPNASFFAGGVGVTPARNYAGLISSCLNHIPHQCKVNPPHPSHADCGGKITDSEGNDWGTLFRAGKWLHLGWVQNVSASQDIDQLIRFYINGRKVAPSQAYPLGYRDEHFVFDPPMIPDEAYNAFADLQPKLRLGERQNQFNAPIDEIRLNSPPDGTIDEVLIWDGITLNVGTQVVNDVWSQGRYYRGNDGVFISRAIDFAQELELPLGTVVTLCYMTWTQYVPEEKWTLNGTRISLPQPGEDYAPTCEIEIWNGDKTIKLGVRKSATTQPDPGGEIIKDNFTDESLVVTGSIRYRVKFLPNVDSLNDILVDPLIFDDITIIYYATPQFLSWVYR